MRLSLVHWLIAAALLANVAVFLWLRQAGPVQEPSVRSGLREIRLLGERDEAAPVVQQAGAETPPPDPPPAAVPRAEPVEDVVVVPQPDPVQQVESPESAGARDAAVAASAPEPGRCWIAGPVAGDVVSERLAAAFAAAGIGLDLVLQTVEVDPDNWVFLPTMGSQAEVRRLSTELQEQGFENFQITDGPLAGSLSLGLFRSRERALTVRDRLRALGHQAGVYLRPAFQEQPWATIDDDAREALGWPGEPGPLPGFESLELRERECPDEGEG